MNVMVEKEKLVCEMLITSIVGELPRLEGIWTDIIVGTTFSIPDD